MAIQKPLQQLQHLFVIRKNLLGQSGSGVLGLALVPWWLGYEMREHEKKIAFISVS